MLYKPCVSFYCLFDASRFNADVSLRHACAAVLQKTLHKGNVKAAVLVDFRCVPLAEAVGADPLKAQIVTDDGKRFLHGPFREGKDALGAADARPQAIVFQILLDDKRHGEYTLFARFLLCDRKAKASPIVHDVAQAQAQDVADPQAEVPFEHKGGSKALIGAEAREALFHRLDDLRVLRCGQRVRLFVHRVNLQ